MPIRFAWRKRSCRALLHGALPVRGKAEIRRAVRHEYGNAVARREADEGRKQS